MLRRAVATAAVLVGASIVAAPAAAKDRVLDFENLSAELPQALLTTQHQEPDGTGLVWQEPPSEGVTGIGRALVKEVPASEATSGIKVAQGEETGGEFPSGSNAIWARFDNVRDEVRLNVGWKSTPDTPGRIVFVRAFDPGGELIDQDNKFLPPTGVMQPASLSAPGIRWVMVEELSGTQPPAGRVRIDDFTFDDLKGVDGTDPPKLSPPDFLISVPPHGFGTPSLVAGGTRDIPIEVDRFNGAEGPLDFSVAGLPPGVQAQWLPAKTNDADDVTLRLSAPEHVAPADDANVTVTATPTTAQSGSAPRSSQFTLDVFASFDLAVHGVEVTQGIQKEVIPCEFGDDCMSNISLRPNPAPESVPYDGVTLIEEKNTYVRVFVGNNSQGAIGGATVKVHGRGPSGKPLPGSPLVKTRVQAPPSESLRFVSAFRRVQPADATFSLPLEWTKNVGGAGVQLSVQIEGPNQDLLTPTSTECRDCDVNNEYQIDGIDFLPIRTLRISTVKLTRPGVVEHPDPWEVLNLTSLWLPFGLWDLQMPDYHGTADISDLDDLPAGTPTALFDRRLAALNRVDEYASDHICGVGSSCAKMVMGIYDAGFSGGGISRHKLGSGDRPTSTAPFASSYYGDSRYPSNRTASHEFAHGLGRVHAGLKCGANDNGEVGEEWPPDDRGRMDGIGYEPLADQGHQNRIFGLPTVADQYGDYMAYCRATDDNFSFLFWSSVTGWERTIQQLGLRGMVGSGHYRANRSRPAQRTRSFRGSGASMARVRAWVAPDGTGQILSVAPTAKPGSTSSNSADYSFVVHGADGAELARVAAGASGVTGVGGVHLEAEVPAQGASRVDLVDASGAVLATRSRTQSPTVELQRPSKGKLGTKGATAVRWRTADPDSESRIATVDYSRDGGKTWTAVHSGPDSGSARITSSLLSRSSNGRIRVRVNDGFNEVAAVSGRLRVPGAPPEVTVLAPEGGSRFTVEDRISVAGIGFDDRRREIASKRLRWFDGKRLLGKGDSAELAGLRPGTRKLRLVARDSQGREGSASVRVRVQAVAPVAAPLELPELLPPKARKLKIRLATNVDATLSVRGKGIASKKRYKVGRRERTVAVKVKRGNATLRPKLTLQAGGKRSRSVAEVPRG